jgi:vesicle transport protein SEC22
MPLLTFVARVADGLLLVASFEQSTGTGSSSKNDLDLYKSQAKQILKKLNTRSVAKCSIESGSCIFHYIITEGIVYLTLCEKNYPKRLAYLYLEDINDGFIAELSRDHGDQWRNKVETAARPYAFIKFDKFIQKKHKEFVDPSSRQNTGKLNEDLADIQSIMKKNIQEVLNRGEKLDHVSQISSSLVNESKKFKWGAKKLSIQALINQYAPIAALGAVVLLVIFYKFFL